MSDTKFIHDTLTKLASRFPRALCLYVPFDDSYDVSYEDECTEYIDSYKWIDGKLKLVATMELEA